jgi:flavin-binding protein dodecin
MSVTKVIEVVGRSKESSDAPVKNALAEAGRNLRDNKALDVVSNGLRGRSMEEWGLPDLLDQVALVSLDRSLKTDDLDLFKSIQRLTRARNSVVHEGSEVSEQDGHQLTVAASQLFRWLDQFLGDSETKASRAPS